MRDPGTKPSKTPVIVGVVVGVGGGLLLLALGLWLWRRKRRQRLERERHLTAQPYTEPGAGEDVMKGGPARTVAEGAAGAQDAGRRSPVRHVVQEEDAEEVYEYLPPRYREAWQHGAPPPDSPDLPESGQSGSGSMSSSDWRPTSSDDTDPPLKRAYARAFSTRRPGGPAGSRPAGPRPLEEEIKRRFPSSAEQASRADKSSPTEKS